MREADFIQRVFRDAAPIVLGGDRSATEKGTIPRDTSGQRAFISSYFSAPVSQRSGNVVKS